MKNNYFQDNLKQLRENYDKPISLLSTYDYYLIGETHPDSRCTDLQKIIDMYVSHTFLLKCLKQLDVKNFYQEGALIRELGDSEATLKPEVRERIELANKRKIKFHWLDEGIKEYTLIRKMNSEGRMFTREWFILQKKRREKWYEKITKESIICVGLWHVPYLFKELSQRGSCYLYPKNWWDNPHSKLYLIFNLKFLVNVFKIPLFFRKALSCYLLSILAFYCKMSF